MQLQVIRTELAVGGVNGEAKDSRSVLKEWCSGEGLGGDVGKVLSGADFGDKDASRLFGVSNHGVTWGYPFGFGGYSLAAGTVDDNSCVGEYGSRGVVWEPEFS